MLVSGAEHMPGTPEIPPEYISNYAKHYNDNDGVEHTRTTI
jgi:hypothetical protein